MSIFILGVHIMTKCTCIQKRIDIAKEIGSCGNGPPMYVRPSRSAMKVENNWSLMKRIFFVPFNKPRLDALLYVLGAKLMKKFVCDYNLLFKDVINHTGRSSWSRRGLRQFSHSFMDDMKQIQSISYAAIRRKCQSIMFRKHIMGSAQ